MKYKNKTEVGVHVVYSKDNISCSIPVNSITPELKRHLDRFQGRHFLNFLENIRSKTGSFVSDSVISFAFGRPVLGVLRHLDGICFNL